MEQAYPSQLTTVAPMTDRRVLGDLTVLIPTLGRDQIQRCLDAIATGSVLPARVVVVDQGSREGVRRMVVELADFGIASDYLQRSTTGRAVGLNDGIATVTTQYVAITDDDCVPAVDWLELMHLRLSRHPGSIVTGRVMPEPGGTAPSTYVSVAEETHTAPLVDRDVLFGGNMGVAVEVFGAVGPFDEDPRIQNAEDGDWSYRALRAGVTIVYAPELAVVHTDWRGPEQLLRTYRGYARSQGALYGKYIRKGDRFMLRRAIFDLLRGPWMLARGTVTRNSELRRLGAAYVRHLLPGLVAGLRRGWSVRGTSPETP